MNKHSSSVQELELIAWHALDAIRGRLPYNQGHLHIVVLFFLKFLSDLVLDREDRVGFDEWRPAWRALIVPYKCRWGFLKSKAERPDFCLLLDQALEALERSNKALRGIVLDARFDVLERVSADQLQGLIKAFHIISQADLRPTRFEEQDELGDFFEWLLRRITEAEGRSGEFHVPRALAELLARVLEPQPGHLILDPFCGSGFLLSRVTRHAGADKVQCAGQHPNSKSLTLCKMNLVFWGVESTQIQLGSALRDPLLDSSGSLLKADVIVCNPPFGWRNWGGEDLLLSRPELFQGGLNPRGGSEYAFLEHMLKTAREGTGRIGIIVSPGALFRQEERGSRRRLVEENLLAAVIGLPSNIFYGTGIPAAILLIDKARATDHVLFVDTSRSFEAEGGLNRIPDAVVQKVVRVLRDYAEIPGFSRRVGKEEIRALDFRLSVASYVESGCQGDSLMNAEDLSYEIRDIESELAQVRVEINEFLKSHNLPID